MGGERGIRARLRIRIFLGLGFVLVSRGVWVGLSSEVLCEATTGFDAKFVGLNCKICGAATVSDFCYFTCSDSLPWIILTGRARPDLSIGRLAGIIM